MGSGVKEVVAGNLLKGPEAGSKCSGETREREREYGQVSQKRL